MLDPYPLKAQIERMKGQRKQSRIDLLVWFLEFELHPNVRIEVEEALRETKEKHHD